MTRKIILSLLAGAAIITACEKGVRPNPNAAEQRYLEAWMSSNYPAVQPSGSGIYVIDNQEGTGAAYSDELFVRIDYSVRSLDGTVRLTTSEKLSQQIGTYAPGNYYGPEVLAAGGEYGTVGFEEIVKGMKIGGSRTAVVPSWLITYERYKKPEEYLEHSTGESTSIYSLTLREIISDLNKWESDSLSRYVSQHFPGLDSCSAGFYFKGYDIPAPPDTVAYKSDTIIYIDYVGRRLDGVVFDTNIADTAKFYGIYDSSRDYGSMTVRWGESAEDLQFTFAGSTDKSDVVSGFSKTVWEMRYGGYGCGMFVSGLGYTHKGNGAKIPKYSPIRFDIYLGEEK